MSTAPDLAAVRRVFVVHGYQAAPDRHWFPWLAEQLAADGFAVTVVALPDSETPVVRAWSETLAAAVGKVDAQTWFVGHSLGCITVLRYLGGLAGGSAGLGPMLHDRRWVVPTAGTSTAPSGGCIVDPAARGQALAPRFPCRDAPRSEGRRQVERVASWPTACPAGPGAVGR
jgi:hypothetical protein